MTLRAAPATPEPPMLLPATEVMSGNRWKQRNKSSLRRLLEQRDGLPRACRVCKDLLISKFKDMQSL